VRVTVIHAHVVCNSLDYYEDSITEWSVAAYLQHVPDWQLVLWREPAGELVRALVWAASWLMV
jgi:hypothetical protein